MLPERANARRRCHSQQQVPGARRSRARGPECYPGDYPMAASGAFGALACPTPRRSDCSCTSVPRVLVVSYHALGRDRRVPPGRLDGGCTPNGAHRRSVRDHPHIRRFRKWRNRPVPDGSRTVGSRAFGASLRSRSPLRPGNMARQVPSTALKSPRAITVMQADLQSKRRARHADRGTLQEARRLSFGRARRCQPAPPCCLQFDGFRAHGFNKTAGARADLALARRLSASRSRPSRATSSGGGRDRGRVPPDPGCALSPPYAVLGCRRYRPRRDRGARRSAALRRPYVDTLSLVPL